MSQVDFFSDEELVLDVLRCADALPSVTQHWPQDTQALFEQMRITFEKEVGDELAVELAMKALMEMGKHAGGQYIYFPKMETLSRGVRDICIWDQFNGENVRELAKKFDLTVQRVYSIIAEQRKIELQRNQPALF